MRKAIDELAAENMLVRRQGKGTFVATHNDPRSFYRFLRLASDEGGVMQAVSEPFFCQAVSAGQDVASALGLRVGDNVIQVKRVLRFNGEPVVFDQIYLAGDAFAGLTLEALGGGERSLYSLLETDFGVRMIRAEEHLRAVAADQQSAALLGLATGQPLLLVERTAYTYGNKPVEWRRGLYSTLHHYYRNDLG